MMNNANIVITGAAGFIGSCLVGYLNELGYTNLILVDEFDREDKELNLLGKSFSVRVERENFFEWLNKEKPSIDFVFHLGARTDAAEFSYSVYQHLNVEYSQKIWNYCTINNIPLVYASSSATYGDGSFGFADDQKITEMLRPLNPFGESKSSFDKWVLHQEDHPPYWYCMKLFNVYGPNEYHKKRMSSMVYHAYMQAISTGTVSLFSSNEQGIDDGEQSRDFIYVKDVVQVCHWLFQHHKQVKSGMYNIGTGVSRTFNDMALAVFTTVGKPVSVSYIKLPQDIEYQYQNYTRADIQKLRAAGYDKPFMSLEEGVQDYIQQYLSENKSY